MESETYTKKTCVGVTVKGVKCKRTKMTNEKVYKCSVHSDVIINVSKDITQCMSVTKKGLICKVKGHSDRMIYDVNFPYGVYMCPRHFKVFRSENPINTTSKLESLIKTYASNMDTIEVSSEDLSSESSSSDKEDDKETKSPSPSPSLESEKKNDNTKKKRKRRRGGTPKKKKTQPAVRCIGEVVRTHPIHGPSKGRCCRTGLVDDVYRCKNHISEGSNYQRCPGITKDGFKCSRVGIPESSSIKYKCHQH